MFVKESIVRSRFAFGLSAALTLVSFLMSCSSPNSSSVKEIAGQGHDSVLLYYIENGLVVQMACRQGTIIYDHSNCNSDRHTVPVGLFYQNLFKAWGGNGAQYETRITELYVRITQNRTKLEELISLSPSQPSRQEVPGQISSKQVDLAALEVEITALADQQARILEAMAHGSADDSLAPQLALVRESLGLKKALADAMRKDIDQLRAVYIAANASLVDEATFDELNQQIDGFIGQLDINRSYYNEELKKSVATARTLKRLEDNFIYDYASSGMGADTAAVVGQFAGVFYNTEIQYGTITFSTTSRLGELVAQVVHPGTLDKLVCVFEVRSGVQCQGMDVTSPQYQVYSEGLVLSINTACESCGTTDLRRMLYRPVAGMWRVNLVCSTMIGGLNSPITRAECTMKAK